MVFLLLGVVSLLVLMGALGMFSRAQVASVKAFGIWIVAIGGLLLATMLFLTGRGGSAIAALIMLGPLVWSWIGEATRTTGRPGTARRRPATLRVAMSRVEALAVLGLAEGASADDVRAAHRRLMQTAHPDHGGSDWLASQVNQARDVLLG